VLVEKVRFRVERVVLHRVLDPRPHVGSSATFVRVGTGRTQYAVKLIDARPDVHCVVAFEAPPDRGLADPWKIPAGANVCPPQLPRGGGEVTSTRRIYEERGDLQ
jgi:hypothetical protein